MKIRQQCCCTILCNIKEKIWIKCCFMVLSTTSSLSLGCKYAWGWYSMLCTRRCNVYCWLRSTREGCMHGKDDDFNSNQENYFIQPATTINQQQQKKIASDNVSTYTPVEYNQIRSNWVFSHLYINRTYILFYLIISSSLGCHIEMHAKSRGGWRVQVHKYWKSMNFNWNCI